MNPNTNEIAMLPPDGEMRVRLLHEGFLELPRELQPRARQLLGGRDRVVVTREDSKQLCNWARRQRRAANRKRMAAQSRRRNRK